MKKEVEGRCCNCGYEGDRETRCPKRKDKIHCVHWDDGVQTDVLKDMLLMVDINVPLKTIRAWTAEQRSAADRWAAIEALGASDNPVKRLPKPKFLPPSVSEKRMAKVQSGD